MDKARILATRREPPAAWCCAVELKRQEQVERVVRHLLEAFASIEFDCIRFGIDDYANSTDFRSKSRQPRNRVSQ